MQRRMNLEYAESIDSPIVKITMPKAKGGGRGVIMAPTTTKNQPNAIIKVRRMILTDLALGGHVECPESGNGFGEQDVNAAPFVSNP